MLRTFSFLRSCNHLTGYATFSKVSFKMPIMQRVPGGFINKNKVSHKAWDLLGSKGRAEYSEVGQETKIAMIKRQKKLQQQQQLKKKTSFMYHHVKHPGWKKFVRKFYHSSQVKKVPFEKRMDLLADMHEKFLREQRRLHNLELRRNRKKQEKLLKKIVKAEVKK